MDWMNNLFVVLLLTTVTGSIFYLIGLIFDKVWSGNDIKVLRLQLRMTQWAFLLPCVYVVVYIRERKRMPIAGSIINLFYNTLLIRKLCAALACIWIVLFVILFIRKMWKRSHWMRMFDGNIPEEDAETQAMFEEICTRLGITGKVSLYRNDSVKMACMTYWHGYAVVLPLERYTRKETAVVLYHELCHYLNRDLYVGTVSCIVSLLHVFNPLVPIMLRQLDLVCEEYCDRRACQEGAEMFSEKEYFLTILKMLSREVKRERYNLFALADTIGEFERRVQCMKRYHEHGGIKKGTAAVLSVCFLLGSSITALAAGDSMTEAYAKAVEATDNRAEDNEAVADLEGEAAEMSDEEVIEEFARMYDLDPDDVIMMGDEGVETVGDFINIDWSLTPGKTGMTSGFSKEVGSSVVITTIGDPDDIKYQMGIKDPNELMRYAEGTGYISHEFSIKIKGRYYFFVTNLDDSRDIQVRGTVIK